MNLLVVLEPDVWMPVDAHKMSPQVSVLGSSLDSFHGTVNVRAQEALDFSALLLLVIQ